MVGTGRLEGKIALVSGGASGQGASHTRRLASEGATVYFGDVSVDAGKKKESEFRDEGLDVHFHALDVSDASSWQALYAAIEVAHGRLDILTNNAGILDMLGLEDATEQTWQRTLDVNQKGVFLGMKYGLALLRKSAGASVINTSSIFCMIGAPDYVGYHASKGAVSAMTKSMAVTYAPEGIRVNSIHPGFVETPMLKAEFEQLPPDAAEASLSVIPLRRFCPPEEISSVVAFLASEDASYVTGAEFVIDGGVIAGR